MATKFSQITFQNVKRETERFLRETYNKAEQLFSPASPYGHILEVIENLFQLSNLYLQNILNQFDLSNVNSNNSKIIRSAAITAGHNPTRSISATGTLRMRVNSTVDLDTDLGGRRITIPNRLQLKNKTNNLDYIVDLGGSDVMTYNINENSQVFFNITQGTWTEIFFTGDGRPNQTYTSEISGSREVENFNVFVDVNGESWEVRKHLYELLPGEKACIIKTGFNGGVMVIFGNGNFGDIPPLSSQIKVSYIISDGSQGNIFRRTVNDWDIIGEVTDGFGVSVDISNIFDVYIHTDINFGADTEDINFTRNLLPINSNNFVLALPRQYAFAIKKLGIFSHVNAYQNNIDDTIYIVATPNIALFKNRNADYFTVSLEAFKLDNYEKAKIDKYLKAGGNIQLTRKYKIDSPKLSLYILNIFLIVFDDVDEEQINSEIRDVVSGYFLDFKRLDRVPKKDIINLISNIDGVDSVDISFFSKKNEDYHREYIEMDKAIRNENLVDSDDDLLITKNFPDYNPSEIRGLDPVLGDIIFEADEIPVIRGGWKDRNGVFYSDNIDQTRNFASINIIRRGKSSRGDLNR